MAIKNRNVIFVIVATLLTCGIYGIYWIWKTKDEINSLGASIPTMLLILIPFIGGLYFMWKYCEAYAKFVKKDESAALLVFLLWLFIAPIAQYLIQTELNKLAT